MKQTITFLFLFSIGFFFLADVDAQTQPSKIHPYLQTVLLEAASNEMIDVYATLDEQYPLDDLRQQTAILSKKERQKEVVRVLREYTDQQQQQVRSYLENAKQQNLVTKIDVLWAANTIIFSATPEVINYLADNFDEIAEIRYDAVFDESLVTDPTEESVEVFPANVMAPQIGLVLINAPAVWAEGDSGQGVLAANHDSGCDWDHPDLINNIWNNPGEDFDNDGHTLEFNGASWIFDPGDVNGIDDDNNGYVDDFIGWDFSGNDNNPGPSGTHGTQTAGQICGDGTTLPTPITELTPPTKVWSG